MIAAVFPGQGSQKPGMGQDLREASKAARDVFDAASEAIGLDLADLCGESDDETLRQTQNAQIALFTCGVAAFRAFQESAADVRFSAAAGHSVGEYAALVASGTLSIADGARLVRQRGELMSRSGTARPGTMAAVIGLDREALERACREASTAEEVVVIANDNSPGQLVISGDRNAVARAGELASAAGARRVLPLNVSGAFHSPLMKEPAAEMGRTLAKAAFAQGSFPVYANVTAEPVADATQWPNLLEAQLKSPVRWRESVLNMRREGITTFLEFGVGEVLCGLVRRIDGEAVCMAVQDRAGLAAAKEALSGVRVEA